MRDKQDFIIDEVQYQIYPMSPLKANRVLIQMTKLFGKTIANFILGLLKGDDTKAIIDADLKDIGKKLENLEAMAEAFADFSQDIDADEMEKFIISLFSKDLVIADGKKFVSVDVNFANYGLMHMYKVCWASLKANYSDFLDEVAGKLS